MTPEDEAFNEIERQAKQRKEAVLQALHDENERLGLYEDAYGERPSREQLMAEVTVLTELVRVLSDRVAELEKGKEPVAWMTINAYGEEDDIHYENPEGHLPEGWTYKPLYTHPPNVQSENEPLEYWNAVEGWVKLDEVREHFDSVSCGTIYKNGGEGRVPLYTQQRTWVDLTKEECFELCVKHKDNSFSLLVAVQEKLKEENA